MAARDEAVAFPAIEPLHGGVEGRTGGCRARTFFCAARLAVLRLEPRQERGLGREFVGLLEDQVYDSPGPLLEERRREVDHEVSNYVLARFDSSFVSHITL